MAFVKTGEGLNRYWTYMIDAQLQYDTRSTFIRTFTNVLDACLKDAFRSSDAFTKQMKEYPLDTEGDDLLSYDTYDNWIQFFTDILREKGLLGLVNTFDMSDDAADDFFEDR